MKYKVSNGGEMGLCHSQLHVGVDVVPRPSDCVTTRTLLSTLLAPAKGSPHTLGCASLLAMKASAGRSPTAFYSTSALGALPSSNSKSGILPTPGGSSDAFTNLSFDAFSPTERGTSPAVRSANTTTPRYVYPKHRRDATIPLASMQTPSEFTSFHSERRERYCTRALCDEIWADLRNG